MFRVIQEWYQRVFADPEASVLLLFIIIVTGILLLVGKMLAPVFVSIVIAYLLDGLVQRLEKIRCPHRLAVLIVFLLFLTAGLLIITWIIPVLWQELGSFFSEFPGMLKQGQTFLSDLARTSPEYFADVQFGQLFNAIQNSLGNLGQALLSFSVATISNIITFAIYFVLVPFLIYFFLLDKNEIVDWADQFAPRKRTLISRVWAEINQQIANYIRGRVIQIIIAILMHYIVFLWLGLQYALLLAVAAGVSVIIPYIGAIVVTIPVLLVGLLQWGVTANFGYLITAYSLLTVFTGYILEPILLSEAVALHPVAIIVAIMFFGGLWGFWGIFFAIPLATVIKAVLQAWPKPVTAQD